MPVNVGTLVIDLKANTVEFSDSMGKMSDLTKSTAATIVHDLKLIGEAGIATAGTVATATGTLSTAFTQLGAAVTQYGSAMAAANASGLSLMNTYRALRLALSPTMYTVATLAVAALAEETMELVYARAKLIEQQSVAAAKGGITIGAVERTSAIASAAGANADLVARLQQTAGDQDLTEIAEKFAAIEDPVKRADLAVKLFGDDAQAALDVLNSRFINASHAVDDFGQQLDEVARTRISNFRRETQDFINLFTDFSKEKVWFETIKTDLEIIGADVNYWMGRTADWFDQITGQSLLITAMKGEVEPPPAVGKGTTETRIAREDLVAQENAAQKREQGTLEGLRKQREDAVKNIENGLKELNDKQTKLTQDQLFNLAVATSSEQQRKKRLDDQIKAMEDADAAAKQAAAKAKELADWQAKSGERLTSMYQDLVRRSLTSPIAAEIFRGREEVTKDADRTTAEEKTQRAALATASLQLVVAQQLKQFGEDWEKGVAESLKMRDRYFQEQMQKQLRTDEATMAARRGMQEQFVSHDIAMTQLNARPGEELETAAAIRDIHLQDIESRRVAYLTEAEITKLDTERQRALDQYEEDVKRINTERERDALQTGGYYSNQLKTLQQQLDTLDKIQNVEATRTDVENAQAAIEQKMLDIQRQQALATGTLAGGMKAFFLKMQEEAKSAGEILYDSLNSAVDKVSDSLGKLMTGQKADWGKMFKDLGQQMATESTKALLQKGLGALGSKLGINLPGLTKNDGQNRNTAWWVRNADQPAPAAPGGAMPSLSDMLNDLKGANPAWGELGTAAAGIGGGLAKLFTGGMGDIVLGFASGGTPTPGSAYLVGERGPELRVDRSPGTIVPFSKLTRGGGDTHITNIDARGSDIGVTGRIEQAQAQVHARAVQTSVQTVRERNLRTPTFVHQY